MVVYFSGIKCTVASVHLVHPVERSLMCSGHDPLIRFAGPIFIPVLNVPFPAHSIEHLAGQRGQFIFQALKIGNLTGKIRNVFFPAFKIINVTRQLRQTFPPALRVLSLALDDPFEVLAPTVVVLWRAVVS